MNIQKNQLTDGQKKLMDIIMGASAGLLASIDIKKKDFTKQKGCFILARVRQNQPKETSPYENNLFARNRQPIAPSPSASL